MKRITLLLLAFALAGCQAFTRLPDTTSTQQNDAKNFQVEVPGGWVKHNFSGGESLGLTKDGLSLQYIQIQKRGLEKPFATLDVKLETNALISDVAEHYLADVKTRNSGSSVEQEVLLPLEIEGHDGFKLSLMVHTTSGLKFRSLVYGFVSEEGIYTMSYTAPALFFFDKELQEFEQIASSFKLTKPAS